MYKIFGSFLIVLALLAGCGGSGGSGGGGNNNIQAAPATNADLSDLTLSAGPLDQAFQANQTSYTATVGFLVSVTTVTPTTDDANATVSVNGAAVISGTASGAISLDEGSNTITVIVTAEDGTTTKTYTVDVTRQTADSFAQQAYIKAINADASDLFGFSVAVSGDTLAVGAVGEGGADNSQPDAGAVYVFSRDNNGVWRQQDFIRAFNGDARDQFGFSVALSGDTLVVGAVGEGGADNRKSDAGAVYVYIRDDNGEWRQQGFLRAFNADAGDLFGGAVALSGDILAVGAAGEGGADNRTPDAGVVYVFTRDDSGEWRQQDLLRSFNTDTRDQFGFSIALSENTLAIGAVGEGSADNSKPDAGAVYVFSRDNNGGWRQQGFLRAFNADAGDLFGGAVALSGDTLAVGAIGKNSDDNSKPDAGAVYVFSRDDNGEWRQQAFLRAFNADAGDLFGSAVALSGDTLAVGAVGENGADNSEPDIGAAYVFIRSNRVWRQQATLRAFNAEAGDLFGGAVALSGDTLAVGAVGEGSIDNSEPDAGAVYMFK
jgi:ketosteroid isomerase-like protein